MLKNNAALICVPMQEHIEMRKMEPGGNSSAVVTASCVESQGRAISMPRLYAQLQVIMCYK